MTQMDTDGEWTARPAREASAVPVDLSALDRNRNIGYLRRELPCDRDEEIRLIVEAMCSVSDSARPVLDRKQGAVLGAYAERMASLAVRRNARDLLESAIEALGLAFSVSDDPREQIMILELLYDAAVRVGYGVSTAPSSRRDGCARGKIALRDFAARPPRDRSLAAMGYEAASDSGGFRYHRTW